MKEILKFIKQWAIVWVSALIIFCAGVFVFIKARIATNPNITDTTPSALYVNNNETLTAAKRNSLVAKVSGGWNWSRENVSLADTANFDTGCDRKTSSDVVPWETFYFTQVWPNVIYHKANNTLRRAIQKISKWTIQVWNWSAFSSPTTVRVLQKKCQ